MFYIERADIAPKFSWIHREAITSFDPKRLNPRAADKREKRMRMQRIMREVIYGQVL